MSSMATLARLEIKERRDSRRLTATVTAAGRALVECAVAVDAALDQSFLPRCRQETTAEEDERLERGQASAFEAFYLAATSWDTLVGNTSSPFADDVLLYAQLLGPLESGWTAYANPDGSRFYQDGRGRPIAMLTADGTIVATCWQCHVGPQPAPPP